MRDIAIEGFDNIIIEGDPKKVYLPSHYAEIFVRCLSRQPLSGQRFLDMGCGTGVIGIAAAKMGAEVVCSDINPDAIETTLVNAEINRVSLRAVKSEGFDSLRDQGSFDLIACNAPSTPNFVDEVVTPTDNGEDGRAFLDHVLNTAPDFLNSKGRLLSCSGSEQNWDKTASILNREWSDYRIIEDLDEDFSALQQFSDSVLSEWVKKGYCWQVGEKTYHTVRYFFAYK